MNVKNTFMHVLPRPIELRPSHLYVIAIYVVKLKQCLISLYYNGMTKLCILLVVHPSMKMMKMINRISNINFKSFLVVALCVEQDACHQHHYHC
jgi:hypothetical protein